MSISLKLFNSAGAGGDAGGDAAPAAEDAGGDAGQEIHTLNISEARNIFFTLSTLSKTRNRRSSNCLSDPFRPR